MCFATGPPDPSYQLLSLSPAYRGDGRLCFQCPQQQLCQSCQPKVTPATNAHVYAMASAAEGLRALHSALSVLSAAADALGACGLQRVPGSSAVFGWICP